MKKAQKFLTKTNTTFKAKFVKKDFYFDGDKERRDIYKITLARGASKMVFDFGQSIAKSGKLTAPTAYDVLACLQKYDIGTFESFCSEFGYDTDSKRAEKTYNAVIKEWAGVQSIWTDSEIEELQEIN